MRFYVLTLLFLLAVINLLSLFFSPRGMDVVEARGPSILSLPKKVPPPGSSRSKNGNKNKYLERTFTWQNHKGKTVTTTLRISRDDVEEENKKFGIKLSMEHPQYLKKQGFKKFGKRLEVDYSGIYTRNIPYFNDITRQLTASAEIGSGIDPLYDMLKFTQQIEYKIPPKYYQGRYIREFYTPLQCIDHKQGDCDSKSLLLAEFLGTVEGSQEKMAILILRGYGIFHAILAVKRPPLPGAIKLNFYDKGYYVPLEPSAPGWMPGFVGEAVYNCLKAGFFRFEALN